MALVDRWLVARLACPLDHAPVQLRGDTLACECGRRYPVVGGIPIMLRDDVRHTHDAAYAALRQAAARDGTLATTVPAASDDAVDPFVQQAVAATNGLMFRSLVGGLSRYPIPTLRLPPGEGKVLLDVGSNWGRWSIAAGRQGYRVIGVDPHFEALQAAQRVARQFGQDAHFVCADARHLPFGALQFDVVFSYSVLQHFSHDDAVLALREFRRVLRATGTTLVQMPNAFGLRCLYHQARRGLRGARDFEVRYWTPRELLASFATEIGPSTLGIDGFLSINPQTGEMHMLPRRYQATIRLSKLLKRAGRRLRALTFLADSLYVSSTKA